ncbi:hypothetical protein QQ008_22730 [Fulvivirgaceae bacterium BMA10]|uniref:Uncharacterized protein n=1 Tax=Splendidivirga corallicola TaxID=3051826 RepID=A0ABT8KXT5_9BACT|nr:hypothetical protein [Fulvivirgaceae bacterium BMA10]
MELENLKSQFNSVESIEISKESLIGMLHVNKHPTLKGIRIQLIIESIAWISFLAFYYNFFDGHQKPVFWNIALVISVGLMLVHNLLGYQVTNNPINGTNIANSLMRYLVKLKKYAYLSIVSRLLALSIVFGFFLSGVEAFEQRHCMSIGIVLMIICIQAFILWKIWLKRIRTITSKYLELIKGD